MVVIDYKNISVGTICDENIEKCVELREDQSMFFFGEKPTRSSSRRWILAHRNTPEDVLYQITHKKTGFFLGTIGLVKHGDKIEIGRLAVYAKGVCQLLKNGETRESIGEIGVYSCIALLGLIFQTQIFDIVCAEVLATNALSNKLCKEQCGSVHESYRETSAGKKIKTYVYSMTREEIFDKYGNEKMDIFLT